MEIMRNPDNGKFRFASMTEFIANPTDEELHLG